jgi:hypothetical protein
MYQTLTKKKGEILSAADINAFVLGLYVKHNSLSKHDSDTLTTGQFSLIDSDDLDYPYYNYCGNQAVDMANSPSALNYYPFTALNNQLVDAIRKFEGGSY